MHLESFSVSNYRSINQSGVIRVGKGTVLVGRNESGKSNLLLALESLNPPGGAKALNEVKDYPRDRPITDFSPTTNVVNTIWRLSDRERARLAVIYPRAANVETVSVTRDYAGTRSVGIACTAPLVNGATVGEAASRVVKSATAALRKLGEPHRGEVKAALARFAKNVVGEIDGRPKDWAIEAEAASSTLRKAVAAVDFKLPFAAAESLSRIEQNVAAVRLEDEQHAAARMGS